MRFVKVARVALKNEHAALKKLDLLGTRKKTLSGWLGQVKQFYLRGVRKNKLPFLNYFLLFLLRL